MFRSRFLRANWVELGLVLVGTVMLGVVVYQVANAPGSTTKTAVVVENFNVVKTSPDTYDGRWVVFTGTLRYQGPGYYGRMESVMALFDSTGEKIPTNGVFLGGILSEDTSLQAKIYLRIDKRQITQCNFELLDK